MAITILSAAGYGAILTNQDCDLSAATDIYLKVQLAPLSLTISTPVPACVRFPCVCERRGNWLGRTPSN